MARPKTKITAAYQKKLAKASHLYTQCHSIRMIAHELGISRASVSEYLKSQGLRIEPGVGPEGRNARATSGYLHP